ncbi:hect domain protein [Apiospora marii]|uniref:HECT-type E3 ubiquitin transferase n=1 Tax=Apiospora marii TaxID=335849 RepID=A0ABR1RYV2_9PEZI
MPDCAHGHGSLEAEILAALWEEVPFSRLPIDAPAELKELVIDIENPKRVHAIYRASRRHNIQLLVEKFIYQLRYGCGSDDCPNSTCFSCRTRLAGRAPMRRYSPTSARTLAIYLASQDNPESRLCPNLQGSKGPGDAIKPLIFGPKPGVRTPERGQPKPFKPHSSYHRTNTLEEEEKPKSPSSPSSPKAAAYSASPVEGSQASGNAVPRRPHGGTRSPSHVVARVTITERPIRKDYRSFAANVFGTVAFKMLEWLTPQNLEAISENAAQVMRSSTAADPQENSPNRIDILDGQFVPSGSTSVDFEEPRYDKPGSPRIPPQRPLPPDARQAPGCSPDDGDKDVDRKPLPNGVASNQATRPGHSKKRSSARLRTSTSARPQIKVTSDHYSEQHPDQPLSGLKSPRANTGQLDHLANGFSVSGPVLSRQSSSEKLEQELSSPTATDAKWSNSDVRDREANGVHPAGGDVITEPNPTRGTLMDSECSDASNGVIEGEVSIDETLPQSLPSLRNDTIDFICDVLQEDGTTETHMLEPPSIENSLRRKSKPLRRKRGADGAYRSNLRLEWKLFIEQSIFNTLSDPYAILESFGEGDTLLDSQSLWYYMLRMTRVAPSLVLDSLWIASSSLFAPPRALQTPQVPNAKGFPKHSRPLTNDQAGAVLSVCFHALVALAPLLEDPKQLMDMSRIRSHGLTRSGSGAIASQPTSLCLQYEDAFSDDLALRLARRLLTAIPARRYFDELLQFDQDEEDVGGNSDILETLLSHIEISNSYPQTLVEFSDAERQMHEKRVPVLLLDWARTIMMGEWEGKPEVAGNGPFGGALSLFEAMYSKRSSLMLADAAFRTEYFGDRLDAINMPVSWLTCNSTRQKVHLLDYPYIFHPSSLVSYFRGINFSRMSRAYEESHSLQSRIRAIVEPDSLVTEPHQRNVLQDLLRVPSAKFLILDIGRQTVIRDAFDQLWRREERELMRPLKVHLGEDSGEEGFDSGGVQQEFFRLAIAEALNPDFGAFAIDDRTRMTWFQPGSLQPDWKFELIGLLISLALHNGLTLPITFPKALYKRLLGEPVTELHHIADGWPDLANGLTTLLEWDEKDGAVEDIFARTYEFSVSMFGQPVSREMDASSTATWPQFSSSVPASSSENPEDAPLVTGDNREAYVSDYIRYLTDVSVAPQFAAFARGFRTCPHPKSLRLLNAPLLQSLVEGQQDIDIGELKRAARYVGWDASHRTVRDFWSVVRRYDDGMRRKLLEFVTASDRVPVGGMRNIQFVVQRNGEEEGDGGHLPTAYTCYGTLLLPEYRDKEALAERLRMALENAQGFGFA